MSGGGLVRSSSPMSRVVLAHIPSIQNSELSSLKFFRMREGLRTFIPLEKAPSNKQ